MASDYVASDYGAETAHGSSYQEDEMMHRLLAVFQTALEPLRSDIQQLSARIERLEGELAQSSPKSQQQITEAAQDAWRPSRMLTPRAMSSMSMGTAAFDSSAYGETMSFLYQVAPKLDGRSHKGQAGRVGVLGGSVDYTGAPYYAAMASLRGGAELIYVFTALEAAAAIKCYSPELIVSSLYSEARLNDPQLQQGELQGFVDRMLDALPRLHSLCVGPGLGRNEFVLAALAQVIEATSMRSVPLIIDADALWYVTRRPDLVQGQKHVVLTPNMMEYRLLAKATVGNEAAEIQTVCRALQGPTIVQKGIVDRICSFSDDKTNVLPVECSEQGSPRRPGGIGDILAGILSTFLAWSSQRGGNHVQACLAACTVCRMASAAAYARHHRAMVAPDIVSELGPAMQRIFAV